MSHRIFTTAHVTDPVFQISKQLSLLAQQLNIRFSNALIEQSRRCCRSSANDGGVGNSRELIILLGATNDQRRNVS